MRRSEFGRILDRVQAGGVTTYVEGLLRPEGKGGRPRQLTVAVFLTAVICAVDEKEGKLSLTNVHDLLINGLARSYRIVLGITWTDDAGNDCSVTQRQVRYLLEAIELKLAHTQGRAADLTDEDRVTRAAALQNVLDLLVQSSLPSHLAAPGIYALDGTGLASWGKGRKRTPVDPNADHAEDDDLTINDDNAETALHKRLDPDAQWGYQTKTYDNKTNYCFGYHAFAMVGLDPVGVDPDIRPKLIEGIALRPANANAIDPALTLIHSLIAAGRPVNELLSDREFSYKSEESWAGPLLDRKVAQVMDIHSKGRGVRDFNGVAMIDGTPHCRAVLGDRDDLIIIARPANLSAGTLKANATDEEREEHATRVRELAEFRAKIAQREVAAFRRVSSADENGDEGWECPAQAGKVICANCPLSLGYPKDRPVVAEPHQVPALPPRPTPPAKRTKHAVEQHRQALKAYEKQADVLRCCRQRTITIPGNVTPKQRQRLYWGSDAWIESFARRTHVEGVFGNMKSTKGANLKRGWIYVVGIVKTSIMLACVAFATNLRLLRSWSERTGDVTDPLCQPLPPSLGFEELDADGNPDLAVAPPEQ